ncbi:hypothetical protein JCM6882_006945 [Rhodosporidiobolus microsporus]
MAHRGYQNGWAGASGSQEQDAGFASENSSPEPPPVPSGKKKRHSGAAFAAPPPPYNPHANVKLHSFAQSELFPSQNDGFVIFPTAADLFADCLARVPALCIVLDVQKEVVLGCTFKYCPFTLKAFPAYGGCQVDLDASLLLHEHDEAEKQPAAGQKPAAFKMDEALKVAATPTAGANGAAAAPANSAAAKGKGPAAEGAVPPAVAEGGQAKSPAKVAAIGASGSPSGGDKGKGKEREAEPAAEAGSAEQGAAEPSPSRTRNALMGGEEEDVKPRLDQLSPAKNPRGRPAKRAAPSADSQAPKEKKAKTASQTEEQQTEDQALAQQPAAMPPPSPAAAQQPPPPAATPSPAGVQPQPVASSSSSQQRSTSVKPSPSSLFRSSSKPSSTLTPSPAFLTHLASLSPSPTLQFTNYAAPLLYAGISSAAELHEYAALLGEEDFLKALQDGAREAGVAFPPVGRRLLWKAVTEHAEKGEEA